MIGTVDPSVMRHAQRELAQLDRALEEGERTNRWAELGRRVAGFMQRDRRNDPAVGAFVWERAGLVERLPDGFPAKYTQAVDAAWRDEQDAAQQLAADRRKAQQWIDTNRPSEQLARLKWEELTLEAGNRMDAAGKVTEAVCLQLGEAIERWQAATAKVDSAPRRKAAIEAEAQRQLAAIDQEVLAAQLELDRLQ
jgi:hypothetical protein